jgi:hypothetical protein
MEMLKSHVLFGAKCGAVAGEQFSEDPQLTPTKVTGTCAYKKEEVGVNFETYFGFLYFNIQCSCAPRVLDKLMQSQ